MELRLIHPKAVEIAKRGNVPLIIKNTMSECKGTVIKSNVSEEEKRINFRNYTFK